MTLWALGLAVGLPENDLQTVLERLMTTGHVRRRGEAWSASAGLNAPIYQLIRWPTIVIPAPRRHL